jgi:hypothetical protein
MGCDYYIAKVLYIYYNNIDFIPLELGREKGNYYYNFDMDDIDYEEKVIEYKKNILNVKYDPIILYDNFTFKKISYENRYKSIIENEINKYQKKWDDIISIIKVEERYERD